MSSPRYTPNDLGEMELVLGDCANVTPLFVFNRDTIVPDDSETGSETSSESQIDDASNGTPMLESDEDPCPTGSLNRARKRRRTRGPNASEGLQQMLEEFEKNWEDAKIANTVAREEERKGREQFLDIMKKSQQSMSDAMDILRSMAQKM